MLASRRRPVATDPPRRARWSRLDGPRTRRRLAAAVAGLLVVAVTAAGLALAAGSTPAITLSQSGGGVLFGATQTITLTAANPVGQTQWGYNLTYEAVLPANVSYVATTTPGVPAPTVLAGEPSVGETTLIWSNVSDLSPNASNALAFTVSHSTSALAPGSSYTITSGAYVNTDPRQVPQFDATGAAQGATFTGSAAASQLSTISAIALTTAEPSAEGKLLRGVHSHRTVYTLTVQNNSVKQTTGIAVTEYLPADLEFLGCGTGENTTNAPTNVGSALEYPGAPALNAAGAPGGLTGCVAPTSVSTQTVTPPGAASAALYTVVVLPVGTLAAGASQQLQFVAGAPLRANTSTWNNVGHTAPAGIGQASDLDNNSGAETFHGEGATVYGQAAGNYNGVTPVSANSSLARTLMDIRILKSAASGALVQGADTTWTLHIDTGEYRYLTPVTLTDTVPSGLCPIDFSTPTTADGECQASGAADNPSLAWDNTPSEQSDGTWVLHWTLPSTLGPDSTDVITYHTNTRTHYRSGGADTTAISSNDSLTNHVTLASTSFRKCINGNDQCTGASPVKLDGDTDGTADPDSDAASQTATAPTIAKTIQTTAAALASCTTGTYGTTAPAGLAPGDKVCYELRVTFPASVDTQSPTVTDFLPPNLTYVAGSAAALGDDTVGAAAPTVSGNTVTWSLGSAVAPGGVFDVVLAGTIAQNQATYPDGYLTGNLMKTNFLNTPGAASSGRAEQDFVLAAPSIDLVKGVGAYTPPGGGTVTEPGPNFDAITVPGNSAVQWRVDVENQGGAAASAEIWDRLPGPLNSLRCASVSGISNGGVCVTDAVNGDYIDWSSVALGAHTTIAGANQTTLTYTTSIGTAFSPGQALSSSAGVRDFTGTDNEGGTETYYPSANVDPAVTAGQENAPAAGDGSNVDLPALSFTHTDATGVNEAGNNLLTQATIGEDITYTDTLVVPDGTTLYNGPAITSALPPATLSATTAVTSAYSDNGSTTMPANWTTSASGSSSPSLSYTGVGPSSWTNNTGHTATFTLTYTANVLQAAANVKGGSIGDPSTLSYQDETGAAQAPSATDTVTVVEPAITATLTNAGGNKVSPGAIYTYTGGLTNSATANTSTAHDNTLIVTVPAGLSPWTLASGGTVVADGGSDNGWTWNLAARTLTFTPADVAAGASATRTFFLGVDSPAISGASFLTSIEARTTSYPGTPPNGTERTYNTTPHAGYDAANSDTVVLGPPTVVKAVNPTTATFGTPVTYTVTVSLAANVSYYDATVLDTLPTGITYDGATSAPTLSCSAGCTGPSDTPTLATNTAGSTVAFYLGVASATPITSIPTSANARTLVITFYGHVNNVATPGVAHTNNSADVYDDASSKQASWPGSPPAVGGFDQAGTASAAAVTVVEPTPAITKAVSGNDAAGHVAPGDSPAYTVTVKNTSLTWPMYDVHVTDTPSSAYVSVSTAAGVSTTDNTTPWSAPGSTMAWDIPTIPANSSVTLVYNPVLPASTSLHQAQAIDNSASITAAYGLNAAGRTAYPAFKTYSAGPAAVNLTTDMPVVSVAQAPNGSSAATLDTPFTWKVTLTNTSAGAGADTVNVADILPAGWNYVAGSSQLAGVGTGDPSQAGQTLTWSNLVASLAAGQSKVLTFQATPTVQAALTTGIGAATHPHVATASDTWSDASGSTSDADGAYTSGPAPASAFLNPSADLSAVKTLDAAPPTLTEGNVVDYQIVFTNNTSTGGAYAMGVVGTDVLPALLKPQSVALAPAPAWSAGTAYADGNEVSSGGQNWTAVEPSTNQTPGGASPYWSSEAAVCSIAMQTVTCNWPFMGPSATRTVNVMAQVQPVSSGSIANTASVSTTSVDPTPGNNSSTTTNPVQRPTLTLVKSVSGNSGFGAGGVQPSDALTYTLAIHNASLTNDAYDTTVTDTPSTLLSNVVDVGGSGDATSTWAHPGDSLGWSIPDIAPGATVDLTYTATVAPSSSLSNGQAIDNTANVTGYYDASSATRAASPGFGWTHINDVAPSSVALVVQLPSLSVNQYSGPTGTAKTGSAQLKTPYTWQAVIANTGSVTADHVNLADQIPPDWTYLAGSARLNGSVIPDPTLSGPASATVLTFTGVDAGLARAGSDTVTFQATPTVAAALNEGTGTNYTYTTTANVTFQDDSGSAVFNGATPYAAGPNSATASLTNPTADIAIAKTLVAGSSQPTEGQDVVYQLAITDNGPGDALTVSATDTLPANLKPTAADSPCTISGQTVTCDYADIVSGQTQTVDVTAEVQAAPGAQLSNTATVSTTSTDPTPGNNSSTVTTPVQRPQLSIVKTYSGTTLGAATGQPGDPLTYDLAITNTGAATAYDTTVTDQPDPALSGVSDTTGAADATSTWHAAGDSLGWSVPSIAAGQTVHLQYTATLSSAIHDGQSVANTATVTGYWPAPATVRAANPGFAYTHFGGATPSTATLTARVPTLTLTDDTGAGGYPNSANAQVAQPFPWHLVFTNTSAATAHQVVVTDTLPADYSYQPGSATLDGTAIADPTISGQTLTFTATAADVTMLAGAVHAIDFVSVPGTAAVSDPQPQTNHAEASWLDGAAGTASAGGAYQTADATATANLVVPSLTITKTAATPTVDAGAPTTYTITVANLGTVPARHVNVADTLPGGESYTAGSATAIPSAGFSETSAAAPSLSWQIAQIDPGNSVAITLPVALSGSLNAGLVLDNSVAATSDELATPVTANAPLTVTRHVDVSLAKTGPAAIAAGTDATWTLVAHNAGPSDARAVVISDPLPAHTTFKSADPGCSAAANTVTCTVGTLAAGADATYHVTATVDAATAVGSITNTATVTTSDPDTNPANNSAAQTANVTNAVDLGITQTAAQAQVAQTLQDSFTLLITNAGPSDAYASQVVDTLPAGLSYVSASPSQGSCTVSAAVVTCLLGTVPVGTVPTIAIVVQADVPGAQTNAATVSTGLQTDTNPANNSATATITVLPAADLAITKTGPATVAAGGQATYVMTATNQGPSAATGVVLTDQLPAGVGVAGADPGCTVSGPTVSCAIGALADGASAQRSVTVSFGLALAGESLTDTASVTGNETDLDPTNNSASLLTTVGPAPAASTRRAARPPTSASSSPPACAVRRRPDRLHAERGQPRPGHRGRRGHHRPAPRRRHVRAGRDHRRHVLGQRAGGDLPARRAAPRGGRHRADHRPRVPVPGGQRPRHERRHDLVDHPRSAAGQQRHDDLGQRELESRPAHQPPTHEDRVHPAADARRPLPLHDHGDQRGSRPGRQRGRHRPDGARPHHHPCPDVARQLLRRGSAGTLPRRHARERADRDDHDRRRRDGARRLPQRGPGQRRRHPVRSGGGERGGGRDGRVASHPTRDHRAGRPVAGQGRRHRQLQGRRVAHRRSGGRRHHLRAAARAGGLRQCPRRTLPLGPGLLVGGQHAARSPAHLHVLRPR